MNFRITQLFVLSALVTIVIFISVACKSEAEKSLDTAIDYYEKGDNYEAVRYLEKTYGEEPADAEYFLKRGNLHWELSNVEKARDDYNQSILLDPDSEAYTALGRTYYIDNFEMAINSFNQAITLDPHYAEAYLWRGKYYHWQGDNILYCEDNHSEAEINFNKALIDITRSIELAPEKQHQAARALVYMDLGKYEAAIEDFSECIRQNPEASYYKNRASCYLMLAQSASAIDDYSTALELDIGDNEIYFNRGITYLAMENFAQAIEDFDVVIEKDPEWQIAYLLRAFSYLELNNIDIALSDYKEALQLGFLPDLYLKIEPERYPEYVRYSIKKVQQSLEYLENLVSDRAQ